MTTGWSKELFAKNLQKYMDEKGVNQREIADIVGVSPPTVSYWLDKKKYPRIDKIEILANYFGIMKSDLIEQRTSAPLATAKEVGLLISDARIKKGFSREELASKIGISVQVLTKWEKGEKSNISTDKMRLAASILDLDPLSLLGLKDLGRQPEKIVVTADEFSKEDFAQIKQFIQFMRNKKVHSQFIEFMKHQDKK